MEERSYRYECWKCGKREEFDTREAAYEAGFYFPEKYMEVQQDADHPEVFCFWAICSECFEKQAKGGGQRNEEQRSDT